MHIPDIFELTTNKYLLMSFPPNVNWSLINYTCMTDKVASLNSIFQISIEIINKSILFFVRMCMFLNQCLASDERVGKFKSFLKFLCALITYKDYKETLLTIVQVWKQSLVKCQLKLNILFVVYIFTLLQYNNKGSHSSV